MGSAKSNNGSRSSETMTESPDQERVLSNHQDNLDLESNVSKQDVTGSEPTSKSPAQERLFPRSPEGDESAAAMNIFLQRFNEDGRRAAVPFPRVPALQPVNMVAEQSLDSLLADGFGRSSREYAAMTGFQLSDSDGLSEYSDRESSTAQASDSSARDSLSVDSQTRAGAEIGLPWHRSEAAQSVVDRDSHYYASRTSFRTMFPEANVFPPLQIGPRENEEEGLPPTENTRLPSIAELMDLDQWRPWPNCPWTGVHPNIHESRRWEVQTVAHQAPRLVQGPTQRFGPPMKPFDDAISEAVAQEQWRLVTENERRQARQLENCDCSREVG